MLRQEQLQKKISDGLAILEFSLENRGLIGLFDQNIVAQSFFAKLLNIIYGYDLINLDTVDKNSPGIDLGDNYRRIAFQVTSTKTSAKVQETLRKFFEKERYKQYDNLKILILGKKQKTYKQSFDTREIFTFEAETDIIDLKDLVKQLPSLSLYNLQVLSHLIDAEFLAVKTLKNVSELFNKIPFLEYENDFSPEPIE
ncbi:SMEK domain-containing protein [uncultured Nostoc sp.]|uniref:SMEK domain-containing protein n=1 Tax=uncultured Nostoc sp. TaxID=340711 RepID=UPI0035CA0B7E